MDIQTGKFQNSKIQTMTDQDVKEVAKRLRQCGNTRDLEQGKSLHAEISKYRKDQDTYLGNLLVEMYGNCGLLSEAKKAFHSIKKRNVYSWNILIAANARNGEFDHAIHLFREMHQEGLKADKFTFTTLIQTCLKARALEAAIQVHWCIECSESPALDVVGRTELIRMYGEFQIVEKARNVFDGLSQRDAFSWTAMMTAYARCGHYANALELFWSMDNPDKVAFIVAIEACGETKEVEAGSRVHERLNSSRVDVDCMLSNALVSMYGRCGILENALRVFESIPAKTVVSWTAVIGACVQNGQPELALEFFKSMEVNSIPANSLTYVNALEACSSMASLVEGKVLHERIQNLGLEPDQELQTALVKMYGRCGGVEDAKRVFDSMKRRDVVAWSAMITGYATNGHSTQALKLFYRMQVEGHKPNRVTFVSVLSACSSTGLLEEACHLYASMVRERRITPSVDHCACVVDVLGKSGWLEVAKEFINQTCVIRDDPQLWLSLLNACKLQGNVHLGLYCARRALQIEYSNQALQSISKKNGNNVAKKYYSTF